MLLFNLFPKNPPLPLPPCPIISPTKIYHIVVYIIWCNIHDEAIFFILILGMGY